MADTDIETKLGPLRVICEFGADTSGAVTVDWVVLTGSIIGLSIAVGAATWEGATDMAGGIETSLGTATLGPLDLTGGTVEE